MSFTAEEETFTMPLTLKAHHIADQFRQQQPTPQKAKQVYLNTLAVQAVSAYLSWFGIETDLEAGDSWNPAMQSLADTADLVAPQGTLECRPVLPGEQSCYVPPEVWSNRIGYVAVQFNADLSEATLLGFVPSVAVMQLPLSQLRSLEELLDRLTPAVVTNQRVHLSQWLQDAVVMGWQTVEELLGVQQPAWSFRSGDQSQREDLTTTRGKLLNLTTSTDAEPLALLIALTPADEALVDVWVKVCPIGSQTHLPPDLELSVLDAAGVAVMQAQSRNTEMIQLKFKGAVGEKFSIKVILGSHNFTENFVI